MGAEGLGERQCPRRQVAGHPGAESHADLFLAAEQCLTGVCRHCVFTGMAQQRSIIGGTGHHGAQRREGRADFPASGVEPSRGTGAAAAVHQYTSRTYRFSRFSELTYSTAPSASSPPWAATISCSALSTSLAIRVASPQT